MSLFNVSTEHTSFTVDSLNKVSLQSLEINNKKSLELATSALALAKRINYGYGKLISYHLIGYNYSQMANYALAIENYLYAISIARQIGDKKKEAHIYINCSNVFIAVGDFNLSIEYSLKSLDLLKSSDPLLCDIYTNLGQAYNDIGNYRKALFYWNKNIRLKRLLNNNTGWIEYKRIGSSYLNRGIYDSAFYYYIKEFTASNMDSIAQFNYNNNLGVVFHLKKEFKKARLFYKKALAFNNKKDQARTYLNLAELEANDHNHKQAKKYLKAALKTNPSLSQLANVYFLLKMYNKADKIKAIINKNKAIDYANEQKNKLYVRGAEIRITCEIERSLFISSKTKDSIVQIIQVAYIIVITIIAMFLGYLSIFFYRTY